MTNQSNEPSASAEIDSDAPTKAEAEELLRQCNLVLTNQGGRRIVKPGHSTDYQRIQSEIEGIGERLHEEEVRIQVRGLCTRLLEITTVWSD